jgi:hypothetical protein
MSVVRALARSSAGRPGRPPPLTASLLIAVAALSGLLVGSWFSRHARPADKPASAAAQTTEAGVSLQLPSGWSRGAVATLPGFHRPLGLHSVYGDLRASIELLPADSPTLLPSAFLKTLQAPPEAPDRVRLGPGRSAWRYHFLRSSGSQLILYATPTTEGVATIACLDSINVSVPVGCEALASAVTVLGSRPLDPGKRTAFLSRLPTVLADLDASRKHGVRALDAATRARDQAFAADGLARAHRTAGGVLAPLAPAGDGLPSATVGALSGCAAAYTALGRAARARSPSAYVDAGRAVARADAVLLRTLAHIQPA